MASWTELPVDVKVEILCRIEKHKELISLKIISKDWNFVISKFCAPKLCPPDPRAKFFGVLCFQQLPEDIHKRSKSATLRLVSIPWFETKILSLISKKRMDDSDIRDCCNGMILAASSKSKSRYYVGNPLTRQLFRVPVNPNRSTIRCSLVFDPSLLLCENKDPFFKVVSFVRPAQEATVSRPMEVDVYSSDKGEWCSHVVDLEPPELYGFGWMERSVYFNRALYSLSLAMYLVIIDNVIPSPSSGTQDLRVWTISLPDRDDAPKPGCIGPCSGRFYYSNRNALGSSILVWMLGDSEWVLMHDIDVREDIRGHETIFAKKIELVKHFHSFRPRVLHPDDDNDGMVLIFTVQGSYISYKVKTKRTTWHYVHNTSLPLKHIKVDGNCFFPLSPCPLLLNATTRT